MYNVSNRGALGKPLTDPIAFRPSEKAEKILTDYMNQHSLTKKSDALNEIIEGRFSHSPLSQPSTPTPLNPPTPLAPPLVFSTNKPRDCSECRERCNVDYYHCPNGLNDRPAPQP
jgi:hypothetical protein